MKNLTFAFSNAALHWIVDHRPVLAGVKESLEENGRLLFQMAGKGNAQDIFKVFEELIMENRFRTYFKDFTFPYGFYGQEEYNRWLREAGFRPVRVELLPKDMKLRGIEGLAAWIRTTWLPFTEKIPDSLRDSFINEIAKKYIEAFPLDENGFAHVKMVRLEVQATKA